jgi:HK97 family phage major capsid protein
MKDKLLKLLNQKNARKQELAARAKSTEDITELRSINSELDNLNNEITDLNGMISDIEAAEARNANPGTQEGVASMEPPAGTVLEGRGKVPEGGFKPIETYGIGTHEGNQRDNSEGLKSKYEQRGQELKDKKKVSFDSRNELPIARSVLVSSGVLVVPNQYSNTLSETFNQVSSIVDLVNVPPMIGGESYTKGFKKPVSDLPDYTEEGSKYKNVDFVWDKVTIAKTYITDYTEISKQAIKLPNIDYQSQIGTGLRTNLRRKIAKEIMIGDGAAGHFTGIFNAPENVIPKASDLSISKIDADTLDSIVFNYGGDEDVEGAAYLILNKNDLAAFAAIRSTDGKKLYKITVNGNTGTISSDGSFSVNYIINSACPALSKDATAADTYCMAYGNLVNYEMPVFSDIDVEMSTDYKFGEGMVAYSGDIYSGGNVVAYKGFLRIKKKSTTV